MTEQDPHEGCKNLAYEVNCSLQAALAIVSHLAINPQIDAANIFAAIDHLVDAMRHLRDM